MGFRIGHSLAWGRFLYIDDLVTLPRARRQGHATSLLAWASDEAARLDCDQIHLDSGTARHEAHRLYLQRGFRITGLHFAQPPHGDAG
jgi:GNAT superfamily N-acetyltransferase